MLKKMIIHLIFKIMNSRLQAHKGYFVCNSVIHFLKFRRTKVKIYIWIHKLVFTARTAGCFQAENQQNTEGLRLFSWRCTCLTKHHTAPVARPASIACLIREGNKEAIPCKAFILITLYNNDQRISRFSTGFCGVWAAASKIAPPSRPISFTSIMGSPVLCIAPGI